MAQLTFEIADELDAALIDASQRRHKPKTEVARELLEQVLLHSPKAGAAQSWLTNWRSCMQEESLDDLGEARLAHLLEKHLR